jgi:hypothetical protein
MRKMYKEAATILNRYFLQKSLKNYLLDNFCTSLYLIIQKQVLLEIALNKADIAFGNVIEASPATQDVYVYVHRTNSLLGNDELMIKYYQQYMNIAGDEELAKEAAVKLTNRSLAIYGCCTLILIKQSY